jgi:hypothetical protein
MMVLEKNVSTSIIDKKIMAAFIVTQPLFLTFSSVMGTPLSFVSFKEILRKAHDNLYPFTDRIGDALHQIILAVQKQEQRGYHVDSSIWQRQCPPHRR